MVANRSKRSQASEEAEGLIIVGAGIAGLATAAALRSIAGVSNIRVIERFDEAAFRNERSGAGAQLGPNGLRALLAIGGEELVATVMSSGTKLEGNVVVLPAGPMKIPDLAEAETGLPQVLLRWGRLRGILTSLIAPDCVTFGKGEDIIGYKLDDRSVKLINQSGDQDLPPAPLIVAADGIRSTFRRCLASGVTELGDTENGQHGIKYNKRINIKAAVESDLGSDCDPGHTYAFFAPGGGIACFAGPAGDGFTYWAISVADEGNDASGSDDKSEDAVIKIASDLEHLDRTALKAALLEKLRAIEQQELCQFAIQKVEATDPAYLFVSPSQEAESIGPNLVSLDGRVVLVGDSAHAMSPSYGQGSNFALEDAAALALCIRDCKDLPTALKTYERSRIHRCAEMQRRSAERAAKAMNGEKPEDVSKWIFQWDVSDEGGAKDESTMNDLKGSLNLLIKPFQET